MHPQYEHSPPTSSRSTMATVRPPSARRPAACSPAGPAPTITTSYEPFTWRPSFAPDRCHVAVAGHSEDHVVSNEGYKVRPPSMNSVCPVMYAASSEHRNAVAAAISSASPARRIGMWLSTARRLTGSSIHDRLIGVTVAPGPMLLTRMPSAAYS